jgi:hypothetical protein
MERAVRVVRNERIVAVSACSSSRSSSTESLAWFAGAGSANRSREVYAEKPKHQLAKNGKTTNLSRLTLSTNRTEPSLCLSLSPFPRSWRRSGNGRNITCRAVSSGRSTCSTRRTRSTVHIYSRFFPSRHLATRAKLDHTNRAFPTDDQVSTRKQDDISCIRQAHDTFVGSGCVRVDHIVWRRRCLVGAVGSRCRGKTIDLFQ